MKSHFLFLCGLIVTVSLFFRLYRLSTPPEFYFDEVYHGFTATTFLHNDPKGYEYWQTPPEGVAYEWTHPPLAKLFMAAGMVVLGENSWGWRFSSALFGAGVIAMAGLIAHTLFARKKITLLTLVLVSLDGLLLSMSRIAMNDMHFLFFTLVTVYFYIQFRRRLVEFTPTRSKTSASIQRQTVKAAALTALFLALALASKWTALYVGLALGLDALVAVLRLQAFPLKTLATCLICGIIIIPSVYLASYVQFFSQGHSLTQWKETTQQMWWYHTTLEAEHQYQSRPLQWIFDRRPVWLYVEYSQSEQNITANIYNVGNPFLFWTGLACIFFIIGLAVRQNRLDWKLAFPLFFYCMMWMPWLFSPRIMFFYHYAPAVPFLSMLTAYVLVSVYEKHHQARELIKVIILLIVVTFLILYPLNTGYPMPNTYFDRIFAVFPSWK